MISKKIVTSASLIAAAVAVIGASPALVMAATAASTTTSSSASNQTALNSLINRGNDEINRRLTTLNKLDGVINSTVKLSATDRSALTTEVSDAVTGLNSLKTKLDGDTTLATAKTDAQSIVDDYRVYALVVPKVYLLKASDTELVNDDKLSALSTKLQARISADQTAGKDVASLQASLSDLNAKVSAAQSIANSVNSTVEPLQPTDYNSNHAVLEGQRAQLQTAHQDNVAAYNDAKSIVSGLKAL